jgi:hypothetical protein
MRILILSIVLAGSPLNVGGAQASDFSHALWERVLDRFATSDGRVDYAALRAERSGLDRYLEQLAAESPDSAPERFPTTEDRLAYWINAYNATVVELVLAHYPIQSVRDVRAPLLAFFLPTESGFFLFQRFELGGSRTSLYSLENRLIRRRFAEPRVHFALNCASLGCPRLPRDAFRGERLDEQLERETRRFLGEERNLRIDHVRREVSLSSIFDWYRDDFIAWLSARHPEAPQTLVEYVRWNAPPEQRAELTRARDYDVVFVPYDWRLNDRSGAVTERRGGESSYRRSRSSS